MASLAYQVMQRLYETKDSYQEKDDFVMSIVFEGLADFVDSVSKITANDDLTGEQRLLIYRKHCIERLKLEKKSFEISDTDYEIAVGKINEATCASSFST